MSHILEVQNATIRFGGLTAVNNVTLHHTGGEILSLIGPNGAGKTTLFNLLTGVYQLDGGSIRFMGEDISRLKPYERVSRGIARTFQNIRLFSELTVLENLMIAHPGCNREKLFPVLLKGAKLGAARSKVVEDCESILETVGLSEQAANLATNLPYGKQRLLEIGRALATGARLILLDEPGAGMNAVEKAELTALIMHITKQRKRHVLLIEHDMKFVMNISNRIIVLDYGEKIAEGMPEDIQGNERVVEAYLGKTHFADDDAGALFAGEEADADA